MIERWKWSHEDRAMSTETEDRANYTNTHPSVLSTFFSPSVLSTFFLLRGDASSTCNDPVAPWQVLGKVVAVQREGRRVGLTSRRAKIVRIVRTWIAWIKRRVSTQVNLLL